jgi:hypothetical protein
MSDNVKNSLSRRPEARGFRVEQLLEEASLGRIRIPSFQRPLRWRSKHVIEFYDSIIRGFPVGELLLSREHADAGEVSFGSVTIDAPERHDALWVIDGQQRITALVATLLRQEEVPCRDYWAIWYDLENEKFQLLMSKSPGPTLLPLNVLNDSVKQLRWIRNWPLGEEREDLVDRVLQIGKAIREYEIPAYIVEGADENLLRLIFTRSNTGGVNMKESEIFEALYGGEGDRPIRTAISRLIDLGFGQLDEDLFLRCMRITCNVARTDAVGEAGNLPEGAIRRTEVALRRAIQTISGTAGIPHWKLLPYRFPLILLTVFYDKFGETDERIDRLIGKWIWRGAVTGDHEDSTDARVQRLAAEIRKSKSAGETIQNLISKLHPIDSKSPVQNSPREEIDREIRLNRASGKIFILGLLAANPKNPDENVTPLFGAIDIENDEELEAVEREIDPAKISVSITGDTKLGTDTVIRLPNVQASQILSSSEAVLNSYLITQDQVKLLNQGNQSEFRRLRRKSLTEYFEEFINDRIGDRNDLRPSISSIVSNGSVAKEENK